VGVLVSDIHVHVLRLNGTRSSRCYRNHKPTESDLEDDSDDEEEDDPSSWFEDDQDDGRKGQNIVDPDPDYDVQDDLSHIIRIDESKIPFRFHERERV
jgi:hypothetical protein